MKLGLALLLMASCAASHAGVIVSDPLGGQAGSSIHERITPTGGLMWYRQWPWSSSAATVFANNGTGITRGETGNSSAASLWLPSNETAQVLTVQASIFVGSRSGESTNTWGAIGFSSDRKTGDGFPYGPVGNPDTSILRVLLTNSGNWILSSANTTLASGSGIATGSPVTLSLTIDPANALASLRIGGAPVASDIAIPGSLTAVAAAGFQLFDGDAGSGIVKNFSVIAGALESEASFQVRGLGTIQARTTLLDFQGELGSRTTFTAETQAAAAICGSKFLTDAIWGPVKRITGGGGLPGTVLQLEGTGWWVLGLQENRFEVLFARSQAAAIALAAEAGAGGWTPLPARAHPRWMDGFDKSAFGIWVNGGGVLSGDLAKDFEWVTENDFTVCFASTTERRLVAPGLLDDSAMEWGEAMSKKYDFPYRTLYSWTQSVRPEWLWNRIPLPYVQSADGYRAGGSLSHVQAYVGNGLEPQSATHAYDMDLRRRIAGRQGQFENFIGHHGSAEFGGTGIPELLRVAGSPETQALWRIYLRDELGLSLEEVGQLHTGSENTFQSWEQVEIPALEKIFGWNDDSVDLRGIWEGAADLNNVGKTQGWFNDGGGQTWSSISCNDPMIMLYRETNAGTFWIRKTVVLGAAQATSLRYIHISRARWHSYSWVNSNRLEIYVNGQQAQDLTVHDSTRPDDDYCFDLSGALHEGDNQIVINTNGIDIPSYIFLGDQGRWEYPGSDPVKNRIFYDANNFIVWLRLLHLEDTLVAMRSDEPYRPIKIMAPDPLMGRIRDLCERYGAYLHDTGQNADVWAPWMARFAAPRGLITSSEPGTPPQNAREMQRMVTYYLMLGNSAVDMVFHPQSYRTTTDIAEWVASNRTLIHCIGKMAMNPPAIGILRSSRAVQMKFAGPWNWDVGRGDLQTIGRTFNYAELDDIVSGEVNQMYKVLIDTGTAVFTAEEIAGLKRFVEQGGVFVALHNTGMHSPEQAWAWPISELTGLQVKHNGYLNATIRLQRDQALWPSLQNQEIRSTGDALALKKDPSATDVQVVAEWKNRSEENGSVAIACRNLGEGKVITLGSPFWRTQTNGSSLRLDELLSSLGVPRESWRTGDEQTKDVFVERWRSKNGIFDLYPLARTSQTATTSVTFDATWQRSDPISSLVEISAEGNPVRGIQWQDGRMTFSDITLAPMESRIYAAPRSDVELAPLYWMETQQRHWPVLDSIREENKPPLQPATSDVLPLQDGWLKDGAQMRLGSFAVLGLAEDAVANFTKTVQIPDSWAGQRVFLRFDSESWFWGLRPKGTLWINGNQWTPFSVTGTQVSAFSIEVTNEINDGRLTLALEVDGRVANVASRWGRPSGVTGAFYLQAESKPVSTQLLTDWKVANGVSANQALGTQGIYLETRLTLPEVWPGQRLFIEVAPSVRQMGWLMINETPLSPPAWMKSIDISGLVKRTGENVIRWTPRTTATEAKWVSFDRPLESTTSIPELRLNWLERKHSPYGFINTTGESKTLVSSLEAPGIYLGTDGSHEATTSGNTLSNNGHDITTTEGFTLGQNEGSVSNQLVITGGTFTASITEDDPSPEGNMATVGKSGSNNTLIIANKAVFNITDTDLRVGLESDYNLVSVSNSSLNISGTVNGTAAASLSLGGRSGAGNTLVVSNMSSVQAGRVFIGGMMAQGDTSNLNSIVLGGGCELIISDPNQGSLNIGHKEDGNEPNITGNHLIIHANAVVYVENTLESAIHVNAPGNHIRLARTGLQTGNLYWKGDHKADLSTMITNGAFQVSTDGGKTWTADSNTANYRVLYPTGPRNAYTLLYYNKR